MKRRVGRGGDVVENGEEKEEEEGEVVEKGENMEEGEGEGEEEEEKTGKDLTNCERWKPNLIITFSLNILPFTHTCMLKSRNQRYTSLLRFHIVLCHRGNI